jgi:hypothetical protein
MMKRGWPFFLICSILGLALVAGGLLVPAHLRGLDAAVVRSAGQTGVTLPGAGQAFVEGKRLGVAEMLLQAGQIEKIPGCEPRNAALAEGLRQYPKARFWGNDATQESQFAGNFQPGDQNSSFASFIIRRENLNTALAQLGGSKNPVVEELLRSRSLTQTVIFSPSGSAAGQAFDAALCTAGLLLEDGYLTPGLSNNILSAATHANQGGDTQPWEAMLLDFTSLGERFNWDQLTAFTGKIPEGATLHQLAGAVRDADGQLPVLFAVVQLSGRPAGVADYLARFPTTGTRDLGAGLRYGARGVITLVQRQQKLYDPDWEQRLLAFAPAGQMVAWAATWDFRQPELALAVKWLLYLLAGLFLALALHFALRPPESPLAARGWHWVWAGLFSSGFLLVVLLLTEPFLGQDSQPGTFSLRLLSPMTGGTVPGGIIDLSTTLMNPILLLTLLVFFVLQALLYVASLFKLAEIRRQKVPPRIQMKLLENEEHLFDAGLYLGFFGTIVSLIFASLSLVKFSLMAAYSSTAFGIIFVVIFKIFHLRPARRKLLLAAETPEPPAETRAPAAVPATLGAS